jgi:hypothetical protein
LIFWLSIVFGSRGRSSESALSQESENETLALTFNLFVKIRLRENLPEDFAH